MNPAGRELCPACRVPQIDEEIHAHGGSGPGLPRWGCGSGGPLVLHERTSEPLLGTGRGDRHRKGPDETADEQADKDAHEEAVVHDVVTRTGSMIVILFTRPPES